MEERKHNIDTTKLRATLLNMEEDRNGIYNSEFDCWQHLYRYNKLYDLVFDLGTSMNSNKTLYQLANHQKNISNIIEQNKNNLFNFYHLLIIIRQKGDIYCYFNFTSV